MRCFKVTGNHYISFPKNFTDDEVKNYMDKYAKECCFSQISWVEPNLFGIKNFYSYNDNIDYIRDKI